MGDPRDFGHLLQFWYASLRRHHGLSHVVSGMRNDAFYATLLRQACVAALSQMRLCTEWSVCIVHYIRKMNYDANWLLMRATVFYTLWRLFVFFILCLYLFTFIFRHNVCNRFKLTHSVWAFYCPIMLKRERFHQQRAVNLKKPKARVLIGKPNQSNMSVALQLKEASERLSSNSFRHTPRRSWAITKESICV